MVLTCVTAWGLAKDPFSPAVAAVGIFLIAAVWVRYVLLDLIELRTAPIPFRVVAEALAAVAAVMILGFWFATSEPWSPAA
jgi:hypothetical protein